MMKTQELKGFWQTVDDDGPVSRTVSQLNGPTDNSTKISQKNLGNSAISRYRQTFVTQGDERPNSRTWLVFPDLLALAGASGPATVWLDGACLGEIDHPRFLRSFEITGINNEHHVNIEFPKSTDWDGNALITQTGSLRITRLRAYCVEATQQRAVIELHAEVDSSISQAIHIATDISLLGEQMRDPQRREQRVAKGPNRVRWSITIQNPQQWWPHAMGGQPIYQVRVDAEDATGLSDSICLSMGLRTVHLERNASVVNGESIVLKGQAGAISPATARAVGISTLVLDDEIQPDTFYETADQLGLLVWQRLATIKRRDSQRQKTERIVRQTVELLAHRPSVAAWIVDGGARQRHLINLSDPSRSVIN